MKHVPWIPSLLYLLHLQVIAEVIERHWRTGALACPTRDRGKRTGEGACPPATCAEASWARTAGGRGSYAHCRFNAFEAAWFRESVHTATAEHRRRLGRARPIARGDESREGARNPKARRARWTAVR